jgi:hypothetical protein
MASTIDQITAQIEKLEPSEQLMLIERIVSLLRNRVSLAESTDTRSFLVVAEDLPLTSEEVAELLQLKAPMTGKEIAEAGLLGGWQDRTDIADSTLWVREQRANRRKKISW